MCIRDSGYYETIDLAAAELSELKKINPPRLADGKDISDFSGSRIILPDRFTSKYGIQKGDAITLQINGESIKLDVAEIAAYDTFFLRHTRGATALLPLSFPVSYTHLTKKDDISVTVKPDFKTSASCRQIPG